jgi:hypothetical protein
MQQSSRDSSIWRNLAVAFGDGVAFGVGVKLAQGSNRPPAGAPQVDAAPAIGGLSDRLADLEQRLTTIEHAPPPALPPPAPFDQKVLEAVVNALDARLREQSGQVERRITELEARLAIDLKSLERQDHSVVAGVQGRLDEFHSQYNEHVVAFRDAVAQDMDVLYGEIAKVRKDIAVSGDAMEARIAAAITARLDPRMETMEARLHERIAEAVDGASAEVASASAARISEELAPVLAAQAEQSREIAELRQRVADSDQTVLDLILAMGQMCRDVAQRMASPAAATVAEDPVPVAPPLDAPGDPAPVVEAHGNIEPMPASAEERHSRLWRIPLVSSFLILAIGALSNLK